MTHPGDNATIVRDSSALPVVRNTALLSAALASHSATLSLTTAVASITLVRVLDLERLLGLGPANGATLLARTAAGDMYSRSAGRAASPWSCSARCSARSSDRPSSAPCRQGVTSGGDTLAALWLAGAGFELAGLALVAAVRPDPKRIAALLRHEPAEVTARAAPIGEVVRRPGVAGALVAAQASWAVMVVVIVVGDLVDRIGRAGVWPPACWGWACP